MCVGGSFGGGRASVYVQQEGGYLPDAQVSGFVEGGVSYACPTSVATSMAAVLRASTYSVRYEVQPNPLSGCLSHTLLTHSRCTLPPAPPPRPTPPGCVH